MSYLAALFVGFLIGYIFKPTKTKIITKEIFIKEPPTNFPQKRNRIKGVDYERALELQDRKIESKYFHPKIDIEDTTNFFFEKKVVITGVFDLFPDRNDLAKLFWDAGADIDTSLGKNVEYLIVGADYGPVKMKKAIEQSVNIIDQDRITEYFDLDFE